MEEDDMSGRIFQNVVLQIKETTDRIVGVIDAEKYPEYGFESHKGYGSKHHIEMLKKYGPCPIHRKSFIKNFFE